MEYEPGRYDKLEIRQFPARTIRETAEGKYWRQFKTPTLAKQFGPINHIDFCQQSPYSYAISAATRVTVYEGNTRRKARVFSRFKDIAYSAVFRDDGRLLVAGGQDGMVQVFDANSRSVLRQFKNHQRPTHVARFSPNKLHVLSGSDDVTVRWWDLPSGTQVARFDGHTDYVRAASVSPSNMETWATGGYDHVVKLWDVRAGSGQQKGVSMMSMDHGAPIEDLAFFPSGSLLVTAGGNHLCVWDVIGGGRLLRKLTNFQKTVSCVRLSPMAGPDTAAAPRMLAGSLDGHVKIFELDSFTVTHASKYPAPVTSIGISPDCGLLAVGMADGVLSVRRHKRPRANAATLSTQPARSRVRAKPKLTARTFRYFIRGQSEKAAQSDFRVVARRRMRLQSYDKLLKEFKYQEALSAALVTKNAMVVVSILEELAARGGLTPAIAGRDSDSLVLLLRFLVKNLTEPRHCRLLCNITHRVLDIYTSVIGLSPEVDQRLESLRERVTEELRVQESLLEIQGCLEPILAASMLSGLSIE